MGNTRITASRLERIERCPGSAVLPGVPSTSDAAERGIAIHRWLEQVLVHGLDAPDVPEAVRDTVDQIDAAEARALCGESPRVEVGLWWHPQTGEAGLLDGEHRDYSQVPAGAICGTADVLCWESAAPLIVDWKTGRPEYVTEPSRNLQLLFLAVAVARISDREDVTVRLAFIDSDGSLRSPSANLDAFDLDAAQARLRGVRDRVQEARNALEPERDLCTGPHCRYCPAFASCPAQAWEAQALVPIDERADLTPQVAAKLWTRLEAVESAAKRVREVLSEYARRQPIELEDGRTVQAREITRESLDPDIATHVIAEEYGDDVADAVRTITVTKAAIKRAVGKGERKVIDAIRRAGGVRSKTTESVAAK